MRQNRQPLASLAEVAEYLGVPAGTLYNWRYKNEGPPGYRVGKYVRYRWEDVERWLETRREEPPEPVRSRRAVPPPAPLRINHDYRPLRRIEPRHDDGTEQLACGHFVKGRPEGYAQRRRCPDCVL
jgi:excisionase family DNA binding protein